jgi:uncharacterized protein YjiS (DUF1127 family)
MFRLIRDLYRFNSGAAIPAGSLPVTGSSAMSIIAFPSAASARSENRPVRPSLLRLWLQRIRTRRSLAALNPDQLRDAGIEPWRLRHEIRKPFWRG